MKIRYGFVSNSSTSSFCIYGVVIDEWGLLDKLGATQEQKDRAEEEGVDEIVYEIFDKTDVNYWRPEGWGEIFIGFALRNIPDNAVVGEWKKEKEEELKKFLGDDVECDILEESYTD